MEAAVLILPVLITTGVIGLMFLLKVELNVHYVTHIIIGIITNIVCGVLVISMFNIDGVQLLPDAVTQGLIIFMATGFFIIPIMCFVIELIILLIRKVYKNPKAFIIYLLSNVGINLYLVYLGQLFVIASMI